MPDKTIYRCPICTTQSLVSHCENVLCMWMSCRNNECDTQLDMRKKRGHAKNIELTNPAIVTRRNVTFA